MLAVLRISVIQRAIAFVALLSIAIVWFGVLPSPEQLGTWIGVNLQQADRFPCETHSCGCYSAEECWESCCCATPIEKLAWAIENGVQPPEEDAFTENEWIEAANRVEAGSATCTLCIDQIQDRLDAGVPSPSNERIEYKTRDPSFTIASCKALTQLILLALPPAPWTDDALIDFPPPEPQAMTMSARAQTRPLSAQLEVPTPPPRRS